PERLLESLLEEAIDLVGGSAGMVTRWNEESQLLEVVDAHAQVLERQRIRLGEGASGRAALQRAPVLLRRTQRVPDPLLDEAKLDSAIAVPLVHEAQLVGTLAIASGSQDQDFTPEDAELLEMVASTAAAALVALE